MSKCPFSPKNIHETHFRRLCVNVSINYPGFEFIPISIYEFDSWIDSSHRCVMHIGTDLNVGIRLNQMMRIKYSIIWHRENDSLCFLVVMRIMHFVWHVFQVFFAYRSWWSSCCVHFIIIFFGNQNTFFI